MSAQFCPHCGTPTIPQSTVCSSCGGSLVASPTPSLAPGPGASVNADDPWRVPGYPETSGPTPESLAADRAALSDIRTAALVMVFSFVVSILAVGVTPALTYLTDVGRRASTVGDVTGLGILIGTLLFAVVLALVEVALFRRSFRQLARFDPVFRTPGSLALVAMFGLVILGVMAVVFVDLLYQVNQCTGGNPYNVGLGACNHGGLLLLILGVLLVAAVVTAVGYIGIAVGIWRVGAHIGVELFQLAAVLLIVVSIVGAILLLVAVRSARERTAGTGNSFS